MIIVGSTWFLLHLVRYTFLFRTFILCSYLLLIGFTSVVIDAKNISISIDNLIKDCVFVENEKCDQDYYNNNSSSYTADDNGSIKAISDSYYSNNNCSNKIFIDKAVPNFSITGSKETSQVFQLFSHGRSGELLIEGQWRDAAGIASWLVKNKFIENITHLNIYGCEFAKGEKGMDAVVHLEKYLGITVAASDDLTGIDGDWKLEVGLNNYVLHLETYAFNLQACTNCYDTCLLEPGEALVTCGSFSSSNNSVVITQQLDDKVIAIFDPNDPVGNGAVLGSNWTAQSGTGFAPGDLWDAQSLGEVFGLATKPNLANECQDFYVTQWGLIPGGLNEGGTVYQGDLSTACDGGAIFKIDGQTGTATQFACLPSTYGALPATVFNNTDRFYLGTYNTYTGLGQITYNKECDVFYVSNFDNGLIYVLDGAGTTLGIYDFGMEGLPALVTNEGAVPGYLSSYVSGSNQIADTTSYELTPWQRRVFGVGYNQHDDKLYFGTLRRNAPNSTSNFSTNNINQYVFSVSIDPATCLPIGSSTITEIEITAGDRSPVSDIVFDVNNNLLLSQMSMNSISNKGAHVADGLHYVGGTGSWTLQTTYETSTYENGGGSAGGTDFGYNNYGSNPDTPAGNCPEESVVFTVDAALGINDPAIYGIAIMPFGGGDVDTDAYLIDADGVLNVRHKYVFGDIETISPSCNLTELNIEYLCSSENSYTFCIAPNHTEDILCDYNISTNAGTLSSMTGNPCQKDTFTITGVTDFSTTMITVDIPPCDGSKSCSLTENIAAPIVPVTAFAIQPSCTDGTTNSDGYLQISALHHGDRFNFSTGSTYSGDTDYNNATVIGTLPIQFNTGLDNPSGSQDYTLRIFNGASDCFTDVVVTMNEQDCTVGCDCKEYLYLNDTDLGEVHKFSVSTTDGTITEIGSPWMSGFDKPHGLGVDNNGFLYIGDKSNGPVYKVDCDGGTVASNATLWSSAITSNLYNIGSYNGHIIMNGGGPGLGQRINVFDPCLGTLAGSFCLEGLDNDWGLQVLADGTILATNGGFDNGTGSIYQFDYASSFNPVGTTTPICIDPFIESTDVFNLSSSISIDGTTYNTTVTLADFGRVFGITSDGNYLYVMTRTPNWGNSWILKIDATTGALVDLVNEAVSTPGSAIGWSGALGLVYAPSSDLLYVSGVQDCISILDPADLSYIGAGAGAVGPDQQPKAIAITTECCPTNNNVSIDTTLCMASVGDILFLQELINCNGTICEGLWQEGSSNSGITYDACDNSITIDALGACGTFTLGSDGAGNNPQCGAFKITVNITVASLDLTVTQTSCTDNGDGTFTANYDAVVDWSSVSCTTGEMIEVTNNGSIIGTIDPSTATSPSTFSLNIAADGNGANAIKAAYTTAACSDSTYFKSPLPCPKDVTPCTTTPGCIGGNTFEDFNCNGTDDTFESGIQGIQIELYDCDNNLVGTGYSDSEGDWRICGLTDGTAYRIEHTLPEALACWATPTHVGSDNGSDIQFLTAPACTQFSISSPVDYCQINPPLSVVCYLQPSDATDAAWTDEAAIVQIPYESGTTDMTTAGLATLEDEAFMNVMATNGEVGSVFGLANDNINDAMYATAFMKRHIPFGPSGPGAIYKMQGGTVTTFLDLNTLLLGSPAGVDGHSPSGNNYQLDDIWDVVGKNSFGDLIITPDGQYLYTVTLSDMDRKLYRIAIPSDGSNPTASDIESFDLPSPSDCPNHPSTGAGELNYNVRPGALTYEQGMLYVGLTCTAESSQNVNDLKGYVYSFQPTGNNFSGPLLTIPFNYNRADITTTPSVLPGNFYPWNANQLTTTTTPAVNGDHINASYPMPWLMNIDFSDDGCMILGIADRFGHLSSGAHNPPAQLNGNSGGDILKTCNLSGTWTLENNANDGINPTTSGAGTTSGPGGGEFFFDENYESFHNEISNGGFAILPGLDELVLGVYDPAPVNGTLPGGSNGFDSGGLIYLNTSDGSRTRSYMLFNRNDYPDFGFDKASATGGVVFNCEPSPLEIGNYVWCDSIENGIQDACEKGINDMLVQLYDAAGDLVGQDTTVNGNYYFNQYNVDTTGITVDGSGVATPTTGWTGMSFETKYYIVFGKSQVESGAIYIGSEIYNGLTIPNANSNANDNIDSDVDSMNLSVALGDMPAGLPAICITTNSIGCGDHKYDMGVRCFIEPLECICPTPYSLCWDESGFVEPPNDDAATFPYSNTMTNIDDSGIDLTLTLFQPSRDGGSDTDPQQSYVSPGSKCGCTFDDELGNYLSCGEVFRNWARAEPTPDTVIMTFSEPIKLPVWGFGGFKTSQGGIESAVASFTFYDGPNATGNKVVSTLPNPGGRAQINTGDPLIAAINELQDQGTQETELYNGTYYYEGQNNVRGWTILDMGDAVIYSIMVTQFTVEDGLSPVDYVPIAPSAQNNSGYWASLDFERCACVCPEIDSLIADRIICSGDLVDSLSVTTTFQNPDSIAFVYFNSIQTDSSIIYSAGMGIDTVQITNSTDTISILNINEFTNISAIPDTFYIYGIAHPRPTDNTCRPYEEILVIVHPEPELETRDTIICIGQNIDLSLLVSDNSSTTGTTTFHSDFPITSANQLGSSIVSPADTTVYYVFYTGLNCSDVDSLVINTTSVAVTVNDAVKCTSDEEAMIATPTGGIPIFHYSWSGPFITNPGNVASFTTNIPGIYTVIITDSNGCTDTKDGELTFQTKTCLPVNVTIKRGN